MNYRETPRFHLKRFLDSSNVSEIEFEAEVCGVMEIMRRLRSLVRRMRGSADR